MLIHSLVELSPIGCYTLISHSLCIWGIFGGILGYYINQLVKQHSIVVIVKGNYILKSIALSEKKTKWNIEKKKEDLRVKQHEKKKKIYYKIIQQGIMSKRKPWMQS